MAGRISYYGNIVRNGLVLDFDAAKRDSYPANGLVIRDITGTSVKGDFINGPTFSSNNGGSITFDGTDDWVRIDSNNNIQPSAELSLESWFNSFGSNGRTQGFFYVNYGLGLRLSTTGQIHSRVNSGAVSYQNTTTLDGVTSPSHLTNVFVSSTDFLTVSIDVSKTCVKSISGNSLVLNIINSLCS